jgi:hypothetical protein
MVPATKPSVVAGVPTEAPKVPVETVKKPAAGMPTGRTKGAEESVRPVAQAPVTEGRISGAWWLLPIFLTWVGGLIAWACTKDRNPKKARSMLFWGIGLTFLYGALWFIMMLILALATGGNVAIQLPW